MVLQNGTERSLTGAPSGAPTANSGPFIEAQVSHHVLQSAIFILQLLQPLRFAQFHAAVFCFSRFIISLTPSPLATPSPSLMLPLIQCADDLLFGVFDSFFTEIPLFAFLLVELLNGRTRLSRSTQATTPEGDN